MPKRKYLRVMTFGWIFFLFIFCELYTSSLTSLITNERRKISHVATNTDECIRMWLCCRVPPHACARDRARPLFVQSQMTEPVYAKHSEAPETNTR